MSGDDGEGVRRSGAEGRGPHGNSEPTAGAAQRGRRGSPKERGPEGAEARRGGGRMTGLPTKTRWEPEGWGGSEAPKVVGPSIGQGDAFRCFVSFSCCFF